MSQIANGQVRRGKRHPFYKSGRICFKGKTYDLEAAYKQFADECARQEPGWVSDRAVAISAMQQYAK